MAVPNALILEDDESVAVTLAAILTDEGFAVTTATSVEAGLAAIEGVRFDVALLDLTLGGGNGLAVLNRLHETSPETVAIILTGYGSLETAVQAIRGGARAYLLKPCNVPNLKATIAEEIERRHRTEAEATRRQLAFFAEASAALASSLDYAATLATVARLAVPRLSEWCMVYLVGDDGMPRRVAAAHVDAEKDQLMQELVVSYPMSVDAAHPVRRAMRTRMSVITPEVRDEEVDRFATSPEHSAILRALTVRSAAIVPLVARGQTLGAMSFAPTGRRGGSASLDMTVAEELARRAALAIDNARLYRQAQSAIRTRDEFLGSASHDLRTPLTSIKAHAQLLHRRVSRLPEAERAAWATGLESIESSTTRMAVIINELIDVAHLRMGQALVLERRPLDLVDLVRRIVDEAQATTSRHRISVQTESPELVGSWDGFRLERVVGNILSNAIKFSPDGGEVVVTLRREETEGRAWAVLSVRDPGVGIPADDLPRIFEHFHRARNVRTQIRGAGIGLAGSRQIVEQQGGTIEAASSEGQGSLFTVRLPVDGADGRAV